MPFGNQELTDTGVSYLAQAQLGDELRIRRMVVGQGIAANIPDDLWTLTALIDYAQDIPITSSEYVTPDTIKVVGLLDSSTIPLGGGFDLNEIGLMVECGTLPEALYSVDNTGGGGDQIPDMGGTSPVIQQIEIYIKIARVDNITINIQPAGTYDAINRGLATIGPGPYIEKVGDVLHFKRFIAGPGIELIEDALIPPETITIGIKVLEADLDLYVPLTNPGGTADTRFDTIQEAIAYLDAYRIPKNLLARINVDAGDFDIPALMEFNHPDGDQISILGAPVEYRDTTSIDTTNNFLNLAMPTASILVGDHIRVGGTGGGDPVWYGLWPVAQIIDANNLQCSVGYQYAYPRTTIPSVNRVTIWKTRLLCVGGGIAIGPNGIKEINNIQLLGSNIGDGISSAGFTVLTKVSLGSFGRGVTATSAGGLLTVDECAVFNSDVGIGIFQRAFLNIVSSVLNGNGYGIHCRQGGYNFGAGVDFTVINNSRISGIRTDTGGSGASYFIYVVYNEEGIRIDGDSFHMFDTVGGQNFPSYVRSNGAGSDNGGMGTLSILASNSSSVHGVMNGGVLGPTVPPNAIAYAAPYGQLINTVDGMTGNPIQITVETPYPNRGTRSVDNSYICVEL